MFYLFSGKQPLVVYKSQRVVLPDVVAPASIVTRNGKIISILPYNSGRNELGISDEYVFYDTSSQQIP